MLKEKVNKETLSEEYVKEFLISFKTTLEHHRKIGNFLKRSKWKKIFELLKAGLRVGVETFFGGIFVNILSEIINLIVLMYENQQ